MFDFSSVLLHLFLTFSAGDVNNILIGSNVHIQDGVIVHVAKNGLRGVPIPTIIGGTTWLIYSFRISNMCLYL